MAIRRRGAAAGQSGDARRNGDSRDRTAGVVSPWLLQAKVAVPATPADYLARPHLVRQVEAAVQRRLTVLQAPGGFGKTTVLSDVCRRVAGQGVLVGWLTLDAEDTPTVFGSYVALALEHAGLDLVAVFGPGAWALAPTARRIGMLARAVDQHPAPCLLVLDEVERLPRQTVGLIDRLIKRAPTNLHFAVACRSNPGLDLAAHVLDGSAVIVGPSAFRFSRHDIARLFRGDLSRRQLVAVEQRTAGWPVALTVYRNMQARETAGLPADTANLTDNFVGVRLLGDLTAADRRLLLDLSVFDTIEDELLDEVLGSSDARRRVAALSVLDGLLQPADSGDGVDVLHPLVRKYCLERFAVEDPRRKRTLHGRIARAFARRGQLEPAWRHARATGDRELVAELIEDAGITGLWSRGGTPLILAAASKVAQRLVESRPRLALLRCMALQYSGQAAEAAALYRMAEPRTRPDVRGTGSVDAAALVADRLLVQAVLAGSAGDLPPGSLEAALSGERAAAPAAAIPSLRRGVLHMLRCCASQERASFADSLQHAQQALSCFGEDAPGGAVYVEVGLGLGAMATGRPRDAAAAYRRARQIARRYGASDAHLAAIIDIVALELDLERHRRKAIQPRSLRAVSDADRVWSDIHAASIAVRAELAREQGCGGDAVALVERAMADLPRTGPGGRERFLRALLADCLLDAGQAAAAAGVWRDASLPAATSDLVDLDTQSWRTMEMLSGTRVRLLAAQGDLGAAAALAAAGASAASARGLVRTAMRGHALSMVVAHHAGAPGRVAAALAAFLDHARTADYFRPLQRHRDVSLVALRRLLADNPEAGRRAAAEAALERLDQAPANATSDLTPREIEVLAELRLGRRNKEIAQRLGITDEGVRYHLKKIYRKVGVSGRDAARRYVSAGGKIPVEQ